MPYPDYTLRPSGGDFTSMSEAEAQMATEFTDSDPVTLTCYKGDYGNGPDGGLNDAADFSGWGTLPTATNTVTIKVAPGSEHNGVSRSGFYMDNAGKNIATLELKSLPFSIVDGLEFLATDRYRFGLSVDRDDIVRNVIVTNNYSGGGNLDAELLQAGPNAVGLILENTLIVTGSNPIRGGIRITSYSPVTINGLTIDGAGGLYGIDFRGGTPTATVNNVIAAGAATDFVFSTAWVINGATNASGDLTAPGTAPITGVNLTDGIDFVSPSSLNFVPTLTGKLYSTGTNLGDPSFDIRGVQRQGAGWEVGAYEVQESAQPPNYKLGLGPGYDFASMAEAEPQMQGDWDGSQPFTLECAAFVDKSTPVVWDGWSPNPTQANNVTVRAEAGAEHNGVFGAGYVLENDVGGMALTSDLRWMVFQDIEVRCSVTGSAISSSGDDSRLERILVNIFNTDSSSNGIASTGPRSKVYNCIAWMSQVNNNIGTRRGFDSTGGATDFYNCTAVGLWRSSGFNAISAASGRKYRNCLSLVSGNDYDSAVVNSDFEFNGSGDNTAAGQPGSWTGLATTDFTDYDAGIFSLVPGGQADGANNPGTVDPSGGAYLDDITRTLREIPWEMGAFDLAQATGPIEWRSILTDVAVAIGDPAQKDFSPYFTGDLTPFDFAIDWWEDQTKLTPTVIPPGFTFDPVTGILETANALGPEADYWYVVTGTDQGSNTATSVPDPVRLRVYDPSVFIGPDIPDILEPVNTPINVTTAERFDGGQGGYRYALLQYDAPDPSWTIAIDVDTGIITGTGPVPGVDDFVFVRREDLGTSVSGTDNYFHILFQLFPDLYYQMSGAELTPYTPPNDPIPPGTLINDWGSFGVTGDGVSGVARAVTGYGGVWLHTYRPELADGDPATPSSGVVVPQAHDRGELIDPGNSWSIVFWSDTADAPGISQPLCGNADAPGSGADGGGFNVQWDGTTAAIDVTFYDQAGGSDTFSSSTGQLAGTSLTAIVYDHTTQQLSFYNDFGLDVTRDVSAANWTGPGANKVLSIAALHDRGSDTVASRSNIWQWATFPVALAEDDILALWEAGFVAGFASAYSNGFSIEFTPVFALSVDDLETVATLAEVTLTQAIQQTVDDLETATTLEEVTLTQDIGQPVNDLDTAVTLDQVGLAQDVGQPVNDLDTAVTLDQVTVRQAIQQTVDAITAGVALQNVAMTQAIGQLVDELTTAVNLDPVGLVKAGQLTVVNLATPTALGQVTLTQAIQQTVADIATATELGQVSLQRGFQAIVDAITTAPTLDVVTISAQYALNVDAMGTIVELENVDMAARNLLLIDGLEVVTTLDEVTRGGLVIGSYKGRLVMYALYSGSPLVIV